ncbi:hypothetical protein THIAE_10570 [Thiomicrospira aerophila AL3]|uniref:Protein BatD n=1 Tax=Thiomicrospira aerophila AL3 TaxID=717772 RepID=W0DUM9_9GAMM|nr:BatD family protein [Thiomicrospira aerophila]AHF02147.1 hypothetical protein THIAE_10570 [Thiomicrospira aerophila AL3]
MVMQRLILLLSFMLMPMLATANWSDRTLSAELEAAKVNQGEIVNLKVLANFQTTTRGPDFSVLMDDFEILSRQASSQLRVINGQPTGTTLWEVALMPRRTGVITIPAFSVENVTSEALSVEVLETRAATADYRVTFMTAEVSTETPYVQQEVLYTLRLYYLGSLRRGSVDMPVFNDFLSERLVNQNQFETLVDDRLYRVIEWVYALYPQKSGELTITPKNFEGALLRQRQIEVFQSRSNGLTLQVKPIPASFPADATWLPARQVQLKQDWQITGAFNVGDTLSRRITLEAVGLQASQLPDPVFKEQEGFRVYADPIGQNQHSGQQGISSGKQQNFTAVFQQAGDIELSEITLPWWNTTTDSLEIARLNARTITVLPATHLEAPIAEWLPDTAVTSQSTAYYWPVLTGLFASLWLITLWLWYRRGQPLMAMNNTQAVTRDIDPNKLPSLAEFKTLSVLQQSDWLKKWWQLQGHPLAAMPHQAPTLYQVLQAIEALKYRAELPTEQALDQATEELYAAILDWHQAHPSASQQAANQLAALYPT